MWPIDAPCLVYTRLLQISGELSEIRDTFHGLSTTQVGSALAANGTGPLAIRACNFVWFRFRIHGTRHLWSIAERTRRARVEGTAAAQLA